MLTSRRHIGSSPIESVAIIDPLNDFGIGGYVCELAAGLAANGVSVDVYIGDCGGDMSKLAFTRNHRVFPVLGSLLSKRKDLLRHLAADGRTRQPVTAAPALFGSRISKPSITRRFRESLRCAILPVELAYHLKRNHYSVVWTQWPELEGYGILFWTACNWLGLRVVHTVHNVLPHEESHRNRASAGLSIRDQTRL